MPELIDPLQAKLFAIAQRLLRNHAEAEDAVQEAMLKYHQHQDTVENPEAWLVTTLTRSCLDRLRRAKRTPIEPVTEQMPADAATDVVELADELTLAFQHLLETLAPPERLAFLLREVFDYEFQEIGELLETSEANSRQLVHRAKKRLSGREQRFVVVPTEPAHLAERFAEACRTGELERLLGFVTNARRPGDVYSLAA
jgi:RNA polymerase sigma-70 factor, ECF subfamily